MAKLNILFFSKVVFPTDLIVLKFLYFCGVTPICETTLIPFVTRCLTISIFDSSVSNLTD